MIPRISRVLDHHYWTVRFLMLEAAALLISTRLGGTR